MADSIPYTTILERVKKDIDYIAEQACIKGYNLAKEEIALSGEYERAYKRGKEDAERKKGKWELQEDILSWEGSFDGYFCSECGHGFLNDLCCNNGADWVDVEKDFKFCPFCGADMRGESE